VGFVGTPDEAGSRAVMKIATIAAFMDFSDWTNL
jgi:hypothetical protein